MRDDTAAATIPAEPAAGLVTLADGSELDLLPLPQEQLRALQWEQEKEFARRIVAAPKGSPERAETVRQAYETVTRVFAFAWGHADKPLVMGYQSREGRLVLRLLRLQQRRGPAARFFEIGYSSGVLLKVVGDAGFPVAGIEVSPTLQREAARLLGQGHEAGLHLGDFLRYEFPASQRPWSLIYWNDVFEHIPPDEILDYLRRIYDLLAPGGQLVTVTPNWHVRPGDITRAFCPPRTDSAGLHLKEYTLREVAEFLRAAGFRHVAAPLGVTSQHVVLCGRGLVGLKRRFEPALEKLPFPMASLLCRGFGLSTTIATKGDVS